MNKIQLGDRIEGKIIYLSEEFIFVDLGLKTDGILPCKELNSEQQAQALKIGDSVTAYITKIGDGSIELSQVLNRKNSSDNMLKQAYDNKIPLKGRFINTVKGGMRVQIAGKPAFCPFSQLDIARIENTDQLVGMDSCFIIMEYESRPVNLIVSRKEYLLKEGYSRWQNFMKEWEKNRDNLFEGKIYRILDNGILVELQPMVIAFLPAGECPLSSRSSKLSDEYQPGDTLSVKVLRITLDPAKSSALLSMQKKQQLDWNELLELYPSGKILQCQIDRPVKNGLVVVFDDHLMGLLPQKDISEQSDISNKELRSGCLIDLKIVNIDPVNRQILFTFPNESDREDWRQYAPTQTAGYHPFRNLKQD